MQLDGYIGALGQLPSYDQLRANALSINGEQQRQAEQSNALQQNEAFQASVNALPADAGAQDYAALMARHPEHSTQVKDAWNLISTDAKEQQFSHLSQIWSALESKRPDLAANLLDRRLKGQQNARTTGGPRNPDMSEGFMPDGQEDEDDREVYDALVSGDAERIASVRKRVGIMLASIGGSDKFAANYNSIQKAGEGYSLSEGGMHFDSDNNLVAAAPYKPQALHLRDGDRDTIVAWQPGMPQVIGATRPAAAPGQPASAPSRGVANNNPGNLEASSFSRSQPGYLGNDGRFAQFETMEQGVAAQERLLSESYFGKGINTIGGIVAKYAPAADGNDVRAYSAFISKRSGIPADRPITTAGGQKAVAAAMRAFESRYETAEPAALRVIAQGAPKPGYRVMAPAEVAGMRGLDPSRAYQMSPQGRISAVPGPRASAGRRAGSEPAGKAPTTLAGVMAPIFQKIADGGTLTAGQQQALAMYNSRRSRSGQRGAALSAPPSTSGGGGVPEGATATGPGGVKMVRRKGKWVRM